MPHSCEQAPPIQGFHVLTAGVATSQFTWPSLIPTEWRTSFWPGHQIKYRILFDCLVFYIDLVIMDSAYRLRPDTPPLTCGQVLFSRSPSALPGAYKFSTPLSNSPIGPPFFPSPSAQCTPSTLGSDSGHVRETTFKQHRQGLRL